LPELLHGRPKHHHKLCCHGCSSSRMYGQTLSR
jgi:hypothetical protein